jgi:excisionase family DNA binding protein
MRIDPGPAPKEEAHDLSTDVMTASEVAAALRLPLRTVYDLADAGDIPHFRLGRRRQFLRETIEAIKARGRMQPAIPADI